MATTVIDPAASVDSNSVAEAFNKAVEDAKPKEEPKVEAKPEAEETAEEPKATDGLTDEERQHAINLFGLLKNKDTALETVTLLAKQAGLIKTQTEAKEAAKTIVDVLREELGEEYSFMADKLAPAIAKITKTLVDENTKEIKAQFTAAEEAKVAKEVENGLAALAEAFDDAETYYKDIYELMDEIPPGPKATADSYFKKLYYIAKGQASEKSKPAMLKERVERNRNDAGARVASEGKGRTVKGEPSSTPLTLTQAVQKALEEVSSA